MTLPVMNVRSRHPGEAVGERQVNHRPRRPVPRPGRPWVPARSLSGWLFSTGWALRRRWIALRTSLSEGHFLGGPRVLRLSWAISRQKGGTLPFVLALCGPRTPGVATAWTYLALHGSYGLIWLIKDAAIPDRRSQVRVTFGGAFLSLSVLGPYWSWHRS